MAAKRKVQVVIDGKMLTMVGNESEEYMRSISTYIDGKIAALRESPAAKGLSAGLFFVLMAVNITDEYFKEKGETAALMEKNRILREEVNRLSSRVEDLQNECAGLQDVSETAEQLTLDTAVDASLGQRFVEQTAKISALTAENTDLQAKLSQMKALIGQLESKERPVETEELQAENMALRRENDALKQHLEELEDRLAEPAGSPEASGRPDPEERPPWEEPPAIPAILEAPAAEAKTALETEETTEKTVRNEATPQEEDHEEDAEA